MKKAAIWIIDFGSQYSQLITRKTRELGFSSSLMTLDEAKTLWKTERPKALVLSGGPQSVFEDHEDYSPFFSDPKLPVLGICYGMQIMGQFFQGQVERGIQGEYGSAKVINAHQFPPCPERFNVWMSHADHVKVLPNDFKVLFKSSNNLIAGMKHEHRPLLGLQFHPEVEPTQYGTEILKYFYEKMSDLPRDWDSLAMLEEARAIVRQERPDHVLCAFSGGVDSLVAATLSFEILKEKLHCFFVDNGLLRPQDYAHIDLLKKTSGLSISVIDAKEIFLKNLRGLSDPELKRKSIGKTFIDVFEERVHQFEKERGLRFSHLLQGTLFPDVIESKSPHHQGGKSVTIKSHHNVGGLPDRMKLKLLEPLRWLFKDEVRKIGVELGLKREWVYRHPFPGPGLGVRILGEIKEESIVKVQKSDQILFEELKKFGLYDSIWQAFTVLLPVKTVGVKGDGRAYEEVICLRLVKSTDGMTAEWAQVDYEFLKAASNRITNEVKGVTRVVYDITSKPPGTIEWE